MMTGSAATVAGFPAGWLRGLPRHAQAADAPANPLITLVCGFGCHSPPETADISSAPRGRNRHSGQKGQAHLAAEAISIHIPNPRPGGSFPKPDSGHSSTIRLTIRVRQRIWNAMKPGFHGVQAP